MTDRHLIAYALLALMALGIATVVWWNVHHSHRRTYARDRARQRKAYLAKAAPDDPAPGEARSR